MNCIVFWTAAGIDDAISYPYTRVMKMLLAVLAALASSPALATQTLEVRFTKGTQTFVQRQTVQEGDQANFMGSVASKDGSAKRNVIVNSVLSPAANGVHNLMLQTEISSSQETFQYQTALNVVAGTALAAAECGGWKVAVALGGGKGSLPPGNYRLASEAGRVRCSGVVASGSQMNVVSAGTVGGRKSGTTLNALVNEQGKDAIAVEYQYSGKLQAQGSATLKPGQESTAAKGDAGTLSLRVDAAR